MPVTDHSDVDGTAAGLSGIETVVLTGGTSGIGRHAALALADRGATVAVVGRNEERGRAVAAAATDRPGEIRFHRADLAEQAAVRELAAELGSTYDRLDVLAHNAGVSVGSRTESPDGVELTLAVNHLAPYLLTHELADWLQADGGGRVVVTASGLHASASLDFEDLQFESGYDARSAYARSKLGNVAFTIELAERFEAIAGGGRGGSSAGKDGSSSAGNDSPAGSDDSPVETGGSPPVTANCFHPGYVPTTALWRDATLRVRASIWLTSLLPWTGIDVATAGQRLVQVIADPAFDERTGCYVSDGSVTEPSAAARDPENRRRLWERSAELVEVDPDWPSA